jgi:tRNA (cytidine/uridine-2'-O-)-methyltransferase
MDYLKDVHYEYYNNYEEFVEKNDRPNVFYITRYGKKAPSEVNFKNIDGDIFVMFGKESTGIPKEILKNHLDYCFRIPMVEGVRSLNLSNCVAIVIYEILRQKEYVGLSKVETIKGENFLNDN